MHAMKTIADVNYDEMNACWKRTTSLVHKVGPQLWVIVQPFHLHRTAYYVTVRQDDSIATSES